MSSHIGYADTFDTSSLFPIRSLSFVERLILRTSFIFYLPRVALRFASIKQDKNPLHDGVRNLSGKKLVASSSDIFINDVKAATKHFKVTINDIMTASMSTAIKQYFDEKGDKTAKSINLAIPANIRFGHYKTWPQVKLENKFAPVPLVIPLDSDI
jgi:hypothetical protein